MLFKLSQYLNALLGTVLTVLFGYIISCFTGGNKNLRRELYSPLVHSLLPPEKERLNFSEYTAVATEISMSFKSPKEIEVEET